MLIRRDIEYILLPTPEQEESITISIINKENSFLLSAIYNPSTNSLARETFNSLHDTKQEYIVVGDLNAKHTNLGNKSSNSCGNDLDKLLNEHGLNIINSLEPTYHRQGKEFDRIDYVLASDLILENLSRVELLKDSELVSDHYPILVEVKKEIVTRKRIVPTFYDFRKIQGTLLNNLINSHVIFTSNRVKACSKNLSAAIVNAIERSVPKTTTNKPISEPIPQRIREMINTRKSISKQFHERAKALRARIKKELKQFRQHNWYEFLKRHSSTKPTSAAPFWRRVSGKTGRSPIGSLLVNNKLVTSDEDKAEVFAKRLESIFSNANPSNFDKKWLCQIQKSNAQYFANNRTKPVKKMFKLHELNSVLDKRINLNSCPDANMIHNRALKALNSDNRKLLLRMINLSMAEGKLPTEWKQAMVTMIPKSATNLQDPTNYRPISITSAVSKVAELLVLSRLNKHLIKNRIISPHQSGFRRRRQTKDNLFMLTQKVGESFANGSKAMAIFFDIQGAFDKVNHDCLIHKVRETGIDIQITRWINNYLRGRVIQVKVGEAVSRSVNLTTSVPQGGILSPTLFTIFINDLPKRPLNSKETTLLFADDIVYLIVYENTTLASNLTQQYLEDLSSWMYRWRLTLAKHKCKCIFFKRRETNNSKDFPVTLGGVNIQTVRSTKFLGLTIDHRLRFGEQVNELIRACSNRLRLIRILSNKNRKLDRKTLFQIYIALIRSLLDYSSLIQTYLTKQNMIRLERIQRTALKSILRVKKDTPTAELNNMHNLGLIEERFKTLNSNFIRRGCYSKNPVILSCIQTLKLKKIACRYESTTLGKYLKATRKKSRTRRGIVRN